MKNIVLIKGSVRANNYTSMAVNILIDEINKHHDVSYQLIDPKNYKLAFPGENDTSIDAVRMISIVKAATAVVIATPEYHGTFSSIIKLIIENLGFPSALAGKPISLLGVAAGEIGAVKSLESLRSVCSHIGGIVLPGPVSIANVQSVFDSSGFCLNPKIETRVRSLIQYQLNYIEQFVCPQVNLEDLVRS